MLTRKEIMYKILTDGLPADRAERCREVFDELNTTPLPARHTLPIAKRVIETMENVPSVDDIVYNIVRIYASEYQSRIDSLKDSSDAEAEALAAIAREVINYLEDFYNTENVTITKVKK